MDRRVAALLALAVTLPGAAITWSDYRAGTSRFWLSGGINMFTFDRRTNPALFWGSTIINALLIAALTIVCGLMLVMP